MYVSMQLKESSVALWHLLYIKTSDLRQLLCLYEC